MEFRRERANGADLGWFDVQAYPYIDDNYAQILYQVQELPTYGEVGDIISLNYDIQNDKLLTVADAIATVPDIPSYANTPESLAEYVKNEFLRTDEWEWYYDSVINEAEVDGFMMPLADDGAEAGVMFYVVLECHNTVDNTDFEILVQYSTYDGTVLECTDQLIDPLFLTQVEAIYSPEGE
jgi:hypothetical protein